MEVMENMRETAHEHNDRVIYWKENQVAFAFRLPANFNFDKGTAIKALRLDELAKLLRNQLEISLQSFRPEDISYPENPGGKLPEATDDQLDNDLNSLIGKHLFPAPAGQSGLLVGFFHIRSDKHEHKDHTADVVNFINEKAAQGGLPGFGVFPTAMPNWLSTSTGDVSHGCPLAPPVALEEDEICRFSPGYWPIELPQLSDELSQAHGEDVTVLILDTIPKPESIKEALSRVPPGANRLLEDVARYLREEELVDIPAAGRAVPPAINICHKDFLDDRKPPDAQPKTGKDVDGNLVGYPMQDHGLFIAGIVRSIAPAANIHCIRVLNDYGVGTIDTFYQVLECIVGQLQTGKLRGPVVINISLVITPYNQELPDYGLQEELSFQTREGLRDLLRLLEYYGITMIACAGNDSDQRQGGMHGMPMRGERLGPRYPAALAASNPGVIAVGAIDKTGRAAQYSDYPGLHGVATYGGGVLARRYKSTRHGYTHARRPIDGLRGLYTAVCYPALSEHDTPECNPGSSAYPEKCAENTHAWAYWSGTSFAVPIITGLAARILQTRRSLAPVDVRRAIIDVAGGQTIAWTGLSPSLPASPVIYAHQDE